MKCANCCSVYRLVELREIFGGVLRPIQENNDVIEYMRAATETN